MSDPPAPPSTARPTPWELILEPLGADAFPSIRTEAEQRGSDPARFDQFALLGFVGATLQSMIADDAPADAVASYTELLYQGYQFWAFGRRVYVFDEAVSALLATPVRDLVGWRLAAPPACYLQLPYQRFWMRVAAGASYEPVDGCFVTVREPPSAGAAADLRVLLALGLRADRPGLSLIPYHASFDPAEAAERARRPERASGAAYESALPGGDRKGLHTIESASEAEALVLRALEWLDRRPRTLRIGSGPHGDGFVFVGTADA